MTENQITFLSNITAISPNSVKNTVKLLSDGSTVPFIARYRKEVTGNLDEVQILDIKRNYDKLIEVEKRKETILKTIDEQGKLNPELKKKIENIFVLSELEDVYLPYKPKKKTRATIAIEHGLEPLAHNIFEQKINNLKEIAAKYKNDSITNVELALSGARDIISEWIADDINARNKIRIMFEKYGLIKSTVKKGKDTEGIKYKDYFEYNELGKNIPSHRFLAINRGLEEGFLKCNIEIDIEFAKEQLGRLYLRGLPEPKKHVELAIEDSLKRLIIPSIENEYWNALKEKADFAAIKVFAGNLRQLLLSAPLGQKRVLAIDPGIRTGCKTVVLNESGELLYETVIFPMLKKQESELEIKGLIEKHKIEAVAIGNGTGGRETEQFIKSFVNKNDSFKNVQVFMVSEQGASIYSASDIAREEFPNKDLTVRGAVSIGRRLMDPLAELVKIDPKSIGVGQYQHDVDQKKIKSELDSVVESCVNQVGVELNTASKHLLSYVSGLGPVLAQKIIDFRKENGPFKSRFDLKKVPRLGEKAFEQSAGFLRIRGAVNPLDNSSVHPERYQVVHKIASDLGASVEKLISDSQLRKSIKLENYISKEVGLPTLQDIVIELSKPGRDPREEIEKFEFGNVNSIDELKTGMVLPGIVTNITAFGCFVDIGVHQDGMVHLSNLANKFIRDPNEVVKVHQKVTVKVLEIDLVRKRIGLSMKDIN